MTPFPTDWKYRLDEALIHKTSVLPDFRNWQCTEVFFTDDKDKLWLTIGLDGTITIEPGYAWDGCSPKWTIYGSWYIGTPDGATNHATGKPYTWRWSCIHDALLQWRDSPQMPYTREQIDLIFYHGLKQEGFAGADLYYKAVSLYTRWLGFWRKLPSLRIAL